MGYVRTPVEIARIRELLAPSRYVLEGISVEFETTPEFIESVTPPCFKPAGTSGLVTVARWQSAVCGEFESSAVMIFLEHEGVVGSYFLTLVVSGDMPVTLGREMWGEPKKLGAAHLYRDGDDVYGYAERFGTRIVQIDATFTSDLGPQLQTSNWLELAGRYRADGTLAHDPEVIHFEVTRDFDMIREGAAELTLTGTPFDPVDEIPVLSTGKALHYTGRAAYAEISRTAYPDRDALLPYLLGRGFDDLTQFRVPRRQRELLVTAGKEAN
jgi:acetoacetate decarboxylase